jgi:hypothetical protein
VKDEECSVVKQSEVKTFGEMCVLSLIYSYVAICRFCAVHCLVIICFSCYFIITRLMFFNIFLRLLSILCILCCIVLCTVSPFVYNCLFTVSVQVYQPLAPGRNPTAVNE